jgi:hypothetical protein
MPSESEIIVIMSIIAIIAIKFDILGVVVSINTKQTPDAQNSVSGHQKTWFEDPVTSRAVGAAAGAAGYAGFVIAKEMLNRNKRIKIQDGDPLGGGIHVRSESENPFEEDTKLSIENKKLMMSFNDKMVMEDNNSPLIVDVSNDNSLKLDV